ncbi:UNVERIFIED_CONTAM: hypothetical protein RMT77_005520 [Armadillidium vulgare]
MKVSYIFLLISGVLLVMEENFILASTWCYRGGTGVKGTGKCPDREEIATICEYNPLHCYCDSDCEDGYLCCSHGCSPSCEKAVFN